MRYFANLFAFFFLIGCTNPQKDNTGYDVEYAGALKNMMHKGDLSAKADLDTFKTTTHLYALGAMENLKGEIQIFNGVSSSSVEMNNAASIQNSINQRAALLVWAFIPAWQTILIPDSIQSKLAFEQFVASSAEKIGLPKDKPFPFLLEGKAKSIDWHIINWPDGDSVHTHQKHVESGLHGTKGNIIAMYLGFYSDAHHTIFTHHSTNMHIHFKTDDNLLAGHVDDLTLGKGMVLKLPKNK